MMGRTIYHYDLLHKSGQGEIGAAHEVAPRTQKGHGPGLGGDTANCDERA